MKKCKQNLNQDNKTQYNICVAKCVSIVIMAFWLTITSCSNLESDLSLERTDISTETNSSSSTIDDKQVSAKCVSIGQEITDRNVTYSTAFITKDLDLLYNDYWTTDHHEFTPNFDKDRDGMHQQMTWYYGIGGTVDSYDLQSLEKHVYNNVVYDFGAYDNVNHVNGTPYIINGYYFMRWIKGHDGLWRVDKSVGGSRGSTSKVTPTTDEGPVICHNRHLPDNHQVGDDAISQKITDRFEAYREALISGNLATASHFWTTDVHLYGEGLDVNREGLYEYYRVFFESGSIVSSTIKLHARFVHDNVAFDIGQSENTVEINGVQSVKKTNYVVRWVKGHDGVWRINRIMDLPRN
ncbi:YybH family protein [Ohtaekwangia kribbensis]|uniref:YybH family protein n=1 Tax=Ohtaekwangia kribbensis TaxID=688913 RepID=A0ABW3JW63_9BACT